MSNLVWFVLWLRLMTGPIVPIDTFYAQSVECYVWSPGPSIGIVNRHIAQVVERDGRVLVGLPNVDLHFFSCVIVTRYGERLVTPAIWIEDADRSGIEDPATLIVDQPAQNAALVYTVPNKAGRAPVVMARVCSNHVLWSGEPDQVCLVLPTSSERFTVEEGGHTGYFVNLDWDSWAVQKVIITYTQGPPK